ncbi:hypothetical protein LXL04_028442 [Taraxacum kok-saghyz]
MISAVPTPWHHMVLTLLLRHLSQQLVTMVNSMELNITNTPVPISNQLPLQVKAFSGSGDKNVFVDFLDSRRWSSCYLRGLNHRRSSSYLKILKYCNLQENVNKKVKNIIIDHE